MRRFEFLPDGRTIVEKWQGEYDDYQDVLTLTTMGKLKKGEPFRFVSKLKQTVAPKVWIFDKKGRKWLQYHAFDDVNHQTICETPNRAVAIGFRH